MTPLRRLPSAVLSSILAAVQPVSAAVPLAVAPSGWRFPVASASRLPDAPAPSGKVAAAVRVIGAEEIRRSGARTLPELLAREAGVVSFDQNGNSFQPTVDLRGFNSTPSPATAVLVDGVRVNEPDFGQVNWQLIPVEDVESVEVSPGPATLFGRGALAGVISVRTRRPGRGAAVSAETGASYGSFNRRKGWGAAQGTLKSFDWRLQLGRERESGWRDHSDADVATVRAKAGWRPDAETDLAFSYERADDRLYQGGSITGAEAAVDRGGNVSRVETVSRLDMLSAEARRSLPFELSLSALASLRTRREDTPQNIGRTSNSHSLSDMASRAGVLQLTRPGSVLGRGWKLSAGIEGGRSEADASSAGTFSGSAFTSGSLVKDDSFAAFSEGSLDLLPDELTATAGFRYDENRVGFEDKVTPSNNGTRGYHRASPRFGLAWNPGPRATLYASYAEAFRAPTALEMTAVGPYGGTPLNPVQARTHEVGLRGEPLDDLTMSASFFKTDVIDEIYYDPTHGSFGDNVNVPKTRRLGLEWSAAFERGRWEVRAGHAYVEATFESPVTLSKAPTGAKQFVGKGDSMPMVPENKGTLEVAFKPLDGLRVAADALCLSAQRIVGDEANLEPNLPAYCVGNLGGSYTRGDWTVSLRGTNVTDARSMQRGILSTLSSRAQRFYVPAPGAGVQAGITWRWSAAGEGRTARRPDGRSELARRFAP